MIELKEDIAAAIDALRKGGVILYPTDTVWGIGCDATNSAAVKRVYEIKRRSDHKALITLVSSVAMLERYVDAIPESAEQILDVATTPTTIIYDDARGLAKELLGADGSVGIRVTHETFSRALCERLRRPVVSTSANVSGEPTPRTYAEIPAEIIAGVDYVVSYRRDDNAPHNSSSVIKIGKDNTIKIIRK